MSELDNLIEEGLEEREKSLEEALEAAALANVNVEQLQQLFAWQTNQVSGRGDQRVVLENYVADLLDKYGAGTDRSALSDEEITELVTILNSIGITTGGEDGTLTNVFPHTDGNWVDVERQLRGWTNYPDADLGELLPALLEIETSELPDPSQTEKDLELAIEERDAAEANVILFQDDLDVYNNNPIAVLAKVPNGITATDLPREERPRFNAEVKRGIDLPVTMNDSGKFKFAPVSSIDTDKKRQRVVEKRQAAAEKAAEERRIAAAEEVQRIADANAAAREGQRVEGGTMDPGQRREARMVYDPFTGKRIAKRSMPTPTRELPTEYGSDGPRGSYEDTMLAIREGVGKNTPPATTSEPEIDASSTGIPTPPSAKLAAETAKANQPIDASSTGIPDPPSAKAAAEIARAAQLSSSEEIPENNVLALQQALIAKGFDPGEPDGVWGSQTAAAVKAFQESAGLSVDGVVGANTAAALGVDPVAESFSRSGTGGTGETTGGAVETTGTFGDEDIRDIAAQNGYGARWFAHPEIGPILTKAVNEGWFDSDTGIRRLEAEIRQTDWYQTHTAASREFEVLEGNDPATAGELISDQVLRIQVAANRIGLTLSDEKMREMGRDAHIEKWSEYELNQFVVLEAEWETGFAGGAVEDNYSVIDKLAGDYMVGHLIDDETRDEWATGLYLGDATQAGITNDIAALAESAFPSLTARIQQGYTARQILNPLAMEVSRLLPSIDYKSVDFMTDPRFQPIIHHVQEDGSERIMTVAEVGKYVRGLEDWQTTDAAKASAQEFADFVGKKFGKVA